MDEDNKNKNKNKNNEKKYIMPQGIQESSAVHGREFLYVIIIISNPVYTVWKNILCCLIIDKKTFELWLE